MVTGAELVAQRIGVRLRTWLGEWLLDNTEGLDWRTWQGTKPFPVNLVTTMLRREIDTTPGVVRTVLTGATTDADTEAVSIVFQVTADDGTALVVSVTPSAVGNRSSGVLVRPGSLTSAR